MKITKTRLREIIEEEMTTRRNIDEGFMDRFRKSKPKPDSSTPGVRYRPGDKPWTGISRKPMSWDEKDAERKRKRNAERKQERDADQQDKLDKRNINNVPDEVVAKGAGAVHQWMRDPHAVLPEGSMGTRNENSYDKCMKNLDFDPGNYESYSKADAECQQRTSQIGEGKLTKSYVKSLIEEEVSRVIEASLNK